MEKKMQRNVRLYYLYMGLSEPILWGPIITLFILDVSKMDLTGFYFMEAVMGIMMFFLQVPTGSLADKIGRKKIVFVGFLSFAVGALLISLATGYLGIWMANIFCCIGFTFISGADRSLLFDSLKYLRRAKDYKQIAGKACSFKFLAAALCNLLYIYLAEKVSSRSLMQISVIPLVVNLIVIVFFTEAPRVENELEKQKKNVSLKGLIKSAFSVVEKQKSIKWIVGFSALVSCISTTWFFTYQPYFRDLGLDKVSIGWIFFCLNLVAAATSYGTDWIGRKIKNGLAVSLMLSVISFPIIIMGLFPVKSSAFLVVLQNFARGYLDPFCEHFVHDRIGSENRATVMSIKDSIKNILSVVLKLLFATSLSLFHLPKSLLGLGIFSLIGCIILLTSYKKIFKS